MCFCRRHFCLTFSSFSFRLVSFQRRRRRFTKNSRMFVDVVVMMTKINSLSSKAIFVLSLLPTITVPCTSDNYLVLWSFDWFQKFSISNSSSNDDYSSKCVTYFLRICFRIDRVYLSSRWVLYYLLVSLSLHKHVSLSKQSLKPALQNCLLDIPSPQKCKKLLLRYNFNSYSQISRKCGA